MNIFEELESHVRSYCRTFPTVFQTARGSLLRDTQGREFIDFFSGAGSLNYGHNDPALKASVIRHLQNDGIVHGLDMATAAKQRFLERFKATILTPRDLDYKVQFVGPTGTNAVEAALKLVRKVKQRSNVVAFTGSYHGLTAGSLAVTANSFYRRDAYVNRHDVSFMPFDGFLGHDTNTLDYMRKFILHSSSGVDLPAAVIVETIQAEGGVNVASDTWLQELAQLCRDCEILLIVDDIQVGVGRTGTFFSFERAGIQPEIVLLSKAISGIGLPMSILLMKPELDVWEPGEHTGTFRGNNLAFVAAAEAMRYWESSAFSESIQRKSTTLERRLLEFIARRDNLDASCRGKGLIYGLSIPEPGLSRQIASEAFRQGLIIETCGEDGHVLKILPPLNIPDELLEQGVQIIGKSTDHVLARRDDLLPQPAA